MEASIVSFCIDLYKGDKNTCGTVTTGGTESIILTCKAHRDYYQKNKNITLPEIIAPNSVHVAFDKACHYLNIKLIKVPVYDDGLPKNRRYTKNKYKLKYNYDSWFRSFLSTWSYRSN